MIGGGRICYQSVNFTLRTVTLVEKTGNMHFSALDVRPTKYDGATHSVQTNPTFGNNFD